MQTDSKQNISGDDESIWQKIVDKAVEFGGDLSAKVGELSDTVKQWAKNLAERISGSKDEDSKSETKQTESSPQTTDINANTKNIQTEQATPTPAGANTLASDIQDSGSSNLPEK